MLVPAVTEKFIIEEMMDELIYTEDYFLFSGWTGTSKFSVNTSESYIIQYASKCKMKTSDGEEVEAVVGFISYEVDWRTRSISNICIISFFKGNLTFLNDVYELLMKLMKQFDRIEWKCVEGNPASRHYDKFIKKYGGNKVTLHKKIFNTTGKLCNEYIYEILCNE